MSIYGAATNEWDRLGLKVLPLLNHTNAAVHQIALETLVKVGSRNAEPFFTQLTQAPTPYLSPWKFPNFYRALASCAKDSEQLRDYLYSLTQHNENHVCFGARLVLLDLEPESSIHLNWLETVIRARTMNPNGSASFKHGWFITILSRWTLPIERILPVVLEAAQSQTDPDACVALAKILYHHGADLTPLIPNLESCLRFAPIPYGKSLGYFDTTTDLTAATLLLEMNPSHPKVWFYFVDLLGNKLPKVRKRKGEATTHLLTLINSRVNFLRLLSS
jgi:hypothetical protein